MGSLSLHLHFTYTAHWPSVSMRAPLSLWIKGSCLQASLSWHSGSNVLAFLPSCEPSLTSGIKLVDIMASTRAFTGPLDQTVFQVSVHCSPTPWFPVTSSTNPVHQNHQRFLSHQHFLSHQPISFHDITQTRTITPSHTSTMQFSVKKLAVMLLLVNFFMLASMALATASVSPLHQPE
jgi:hypothetical protein